MAINMFHNCAIHRGTPSLSVNISPSHHHPTATPRRALLTNIAATTTLTMLHTAFPSMPTTAAGLPTPDMLVRSGMQKFRAGDVQGSLRDFDAAYNASPQLRPYLWQRGLSLYYAGTCGFSHNARPLAHTQQQHF